MYDHEFNHHMVSLGCLAPVALYRYLEDNPNIYEINICLNNDKYGIKAEKNIRQEYQDRYRVNIEYPDVKDWNEVLIQVNEDIKNTLKKNERLGRKDEEYEMEI